VVGVGLIFVVAGIALLSRQGHPTPSAVSSSTTEASAKPILQKDITGTIDVGRSQPSAQAPAGSTLVSAATVSKGPDFTQSLQELARALADVKQEVSELKSFQSQMAHDNAQLAQRLKTTLETAQRNADGAEELKKQLVRENGSLTEQLKANQEQMTGALLQLKSNQEQVANVTTQLKSTQDQITRLSEQKPRPKTIAVAGQPPVNRTQKPASPPSQPRALPRNTTGQPPH
jgi:myosin heavy subunit